MLLRGHVLLDSCHWISWFCFLALLLHIPQLQWWWGWLTEWNRRCRDTVLRNVTLYSARPYKQGVGKSELSGLVVTVCATVIALDARNGKTCFESRLCLLGRMIEQGRHAKKLI